MESTRLETRLAALRRSYWEALLFQKTELLYSHLGEVHKHASCCGQSCIMHLASKAHTYNT